MAEFEKDLDKIIVVDEEGNEKTFDVEAIFEMDDKKYTLLSADKELFIMRVEGDDIVSITDPDEQKMILDAYEIAFEAALEDEKRTH